MEVPNPTQPLQMPAGQTDLNSDISRGEVVRDAIAKDEECPQLHGLCHHPHSACPKTPHLTYLKASLLAARAFENLGFKTQFHGATAPEGPGRMQGVWSINSNHRKCHYPYLAL